jgi:hypothetical protein
MYTSKKLPAIIADYKTNFSPFTKSKAYSTRIKLLADQLTNLSLSNHGHSLDLAEVYYAYLYLDTRYPAECEDQYRFILPSGKVVNFSHRPLYAGKGKGPRMYSHLKLAERGERSSRKFRTLGKLEELGLEPIIVFTENLVDEARAFAFEIDLIAGIGRSDLKLGPLVNHTDGGEGVAGLVFTKKIRDRLSKAGTRRIQAMTDQEREEYHARQQAGKQNMPLEKYLTMCENISKGTRKAYKDMTDHKKQSIQLNQRIAGNSRTPDQWAELHAKAAVTISRKSEEERAAPVLQRKATLLAKGSEFEAATRAKQKLTWKIKRMLPSEQVEHTPEQNKVKGLKRKATLAARPRYECSYCDKDFAYKAVASKHEATCSYNSNSSSQSC